MLINESRPPLPPFTLESAAEKVRVAKDDYGESRQREALARLHVPPVTPRTRWAQIGTAFAESRANGLDAVCAMSDSTQSIGQASDAGLACGAHVVTQRRWYTHHGIYVGNGRVIHYAGLSRSLRPAPVEEVSCEEFADGHAMWVEPTSDALYVGEDAVRRACLRLGEDRYRLMINNCEHLCAWCLYGKGRSEQVERWTAPARRGFEIVARAFGQLAAVTCILLARIGTSATQGMTGASPLTH